MKRPTKTKADDFLRAMTPEPAETVPANIPAITGERVRADRQPATRLGLKHIGGYFAPETVEKVALLRARLSLDNSALMKLAIDELYAKHTAQRAHGDV